MLATAFSIVLPYSRIGGFASRLDLRDDGEAVVRRGLRKESAVAALLGLEVALLRDGHGGGLRPVGWPSGVCHMFLVQGGWCLEVNGDGDLERFPLVCRSAPELVDKLDARAYLPQRQDQVAREAKSVHLITCLGWHRCQGRPRRAGGLPQGIPDQSCLKLEVFLQAETAALPNSRDRGSGRGEFRCPPGCRETRTSGRPRAPWHGLR